MSDRRFFGGEDATAAQAILAAIVDSSEDAIVSKNLDGVVMSWNQGAERIFGYSAREMIGQSITRIIPPDRPHEEEGILARICRGERVDHFETVRVRKDGTRIDVSVTISPLRDSTGEIVGASKVARDISDRKRFEAEQARLALAVENHRAWLQSVVELAPVPMLFVEIGSGRVLSANRAANELAGGTFPLQQPVEAHKEVYAFTDGEGEPLPVELLPIARVARGERVEGFQMLWHLPSGTRHLRVDADVLPALPGTPATGLVVFLDVTEMKHAEAELRAANQSKDEFLAMLSHELRNPLAAITNAVYLLRRTRPASPQAEELGETVDRQVRHLTMLVNDLLDVARIVHGLVNIRRKPVDVREAVSSAARAARLVFDAKDQRFSTVIPDEPLGVEGDLTRLEQVVTNLLQNASRYTPAGGRITLTAAAEGDEVVLRVRDTGHGISAELLPHIFDLFAQGNRTLARSEGGLGLGLTLVRRLVEAHRGTVEVRSFGPGAGSEFTVRLPRVELKGPAGGPESAAASTGAPRADRARSVLVVEDNHDAGETLLELLHLWGYEAVWVTDGDAALRAAGKARPDVVLLDIGLPGLSGYEVARRLLREAPDVFLVALTGYGQEADRLRAAEAGIHQHLTKPVDLDELRELLAGGRHGVRAA